MTATDVRVWFPIKHGFLRRTVGHVKAVDGVSLTVREGETVGVVGESGSGKTTLGLAILRLIRSKGTILYCGRGIDGLSVKQMRPLRRDMQIVFQDPYGSLSPRLSVAEIVEEGLIAQKTRLNAAQRREAVARALADTGLDPATHGPLPARILRRPAPAHRHRAGDGARSQVRRARRADLGARHVGAGADRRSLARFAKAALARLSLHFARPEGGARAGERDHRHAARRGGRERLGARNLRRAAQRLHQGAVRRRLRRSRRTRAASVSQ